MKIQWAIVMTVTSFSLATFAETLTLRCAHQADAICVDRVEGLLSEIGCNAKLETLFCNADAEDREVQNCQVETANCMEPKAGLDLVTSCLTGERIHLKDYDKGITLNWWLGLGSYESDVCRFQ